MSSPATDAKRILVVRLGHLGDVLHTLPAVTLLKNAWPRAEISWLVDPLWAPLLDGNPTLDRVIRFPLKTWRRNKTKLSSWREYRRSMADLRAARFDLAIVFQPLIQSTWIARSSGAAEVVGFDTPNLKEPLSRLLLHRRIAAHGDHVVEKNLELVRGLTGSPVTQPPQVWLPRGETPALTPNEDFLLACPHAGWQAKEWPPERFAELASLVWAEQRMPLVLNGAPAEADRLRRIAQRCPNDACRVVPSDIPGLLGLTHRAKAVIGLDSGPLHLAAALHKPGVALFGPTDPARNGPFGDSFTIIRRQGAPTSYRRRNQPSASLADITAREVWDALIPRL